MVLKKVPTSALRVGMKIHKIDRPWLFVPFKSRDFAITSIEDIKKLQKYGVDEVYIYGDNGHTPNRASSAKEESPSLPLEDTFEAMISDFPIGSNIPVDVYFAKEDGSLASLFKTGTTFSDEAYDLIKSTQIKNVRIPVNQRRRFEKYRESIRDSQSKLLKDGFAGKFLNPAAIEKYHTFMNHYFPINHLALEPGTYTGFDIYSRRDNELSEAWRNDRKLETDILEFWKEVGENLVIRKEDRKAYRTYLMVHTKNWKNRWARAAFVRENARMILEDLAYDPRSKQLMQATMNSLQDITRMVLDNPTSFYALMKINNHDYYTFTHSVNVATLSVALAIASGEKGTDELLDLGLGAMLHDLGKSFLDTRIINKPGRYTKEEYNLVVSHVSLGYEALKKDNLVRERALIPVLQHHEKLNGAGYPRGLEGGQIHPFGRISAIIDIYDALTTERSYRSAMTPFDALNLISMSPEEFDSDYFATFVNLLHDQEADDASARP